MLNTTFLQFCYFGEENGLLTPNDEYPLRKFIREYDWNPFFIYSLDWSNSILVNRILHSKRIPLMKKVLRFPLSPIVHRSVLILIRCSLLRTLLIWTIPLLNRIPSKRTMIWVLQMIVGVPHQVLHQKIRSLFCLRSRPSIVLCFLLLFLRRDILTKRVLLLPYLQNQNRFF